MEKKTKIIPALLAVSAGAVSSVVAIISRYDTLFMMITVLVSILVFYLIGLAVKFVAERKFVIEEVSETSDSDEETDGNSEETAAQGEGNAEAVEVQE